MFFKSKPNLPVAEKSRIEFHFQQIAEFIGLDRLQRPVIEGATLLSELGSLRTPETALAFVGDHLKHPVNGIQVVVVPQEVAKCSGGG
ncbi:MAG: hypothetical protein AB8B91_10050 [Rubripirellula sp.]